MLFAQTIINLFSLKTVASSTAACADAGFLRSVFSRVRVKVILIAREENAFKVITYTVEDP